METRELERIRFITRHFNDLQGLRYGAPVGLVALALAGPAFLWIVLLPAAFLLTLRAKRYYADTFGNVELEPAGSAAAFSAVSIFGPAGDASRLGGSRSVAPFLRHVLLTMALALVVLTVFQAFRPHIVVRGDQALGQHPRVLPEYAVDHGPGSSRGYLACSMRSPAVQKAVFAQMICFLTGAGFLGLWYWRERRGSQGHCLALAILLLGLGVLGTALGSDSLARLGGAAARWIDFVLPALVYPRVALLLCGSSLLLAGLFDHWQLVRTFGRPSALQVEI